MGKVVPLAPRVRSDLDIVDELLSLPFLSPEEYRNRVSLICREAAAEIRRLRPDPIAHVDWDRHRIIDRFGVPWQPQPLQWVLLTRLIKSPGKAVTNQSLITALYGDRADGGPLGANGMIKVLISKIRERAPWPIRCLYRVGYILEGYTP